tara:strand:+ start:160 stop:576 length:417 start_codon:yes stop_codon:yes gene_type:complete
MATYAVTGNAVNISAGTNTFVQESVLDFSSTSLGINETIDVFQIPANTVVTSVGYEIITASTGAGEIDLGDSASAVAFHDSADGDAADGASAFAAGKSYDAANTVILKATTAAFNGKIRIVAVMAPLGLSSRAGDAFA